MIIPFDPELSNQKKEICTMLRQLNFAVHRTGYKHLISAILRYEQEDSQSLSKEIYPYVARTFGYSDWRAVEHSIRTSISHAWKIRNPIVWNYYFPGLRRAPTNKHFIATLAEMLKEKPSHFWEG